MSDVSEHNWPLTAIGEVWVMAAGQAEGSSPAVPVHDR